jgi:hypothetical protein
MAGRKQVEKEQEHMAIDAVADEAVDETTTDAGTGDGDTADSAIGLGGHDSEDDDGGVAAAEPKPKKAALFMSKSDRLATSKKNEATAAQTQATKDTAQQKSKTWQDSLRTKIATEERSKVESEFAWEKSVPKETRAHIRNLWETGSRNPIELIHMMVTAAENNPTLAGPLTQYFEQRGFVAKAKGEAVDQDPMPVLKADTATGVSAEGYQKFQKDLNDWQSRQIMKKVAEQMAPLMADRQTATQREQTRAQGVAYAGKSLRSIEKMPGYKEAVADGSLKKAFDAYPRPWTSADGSHNVNHPEYQEEREILRDVVHQVTQAKNVEAASKKWAADQRKKAGIGTVAGGTPPSADHTPKKKPTMKDLARKEIASGKYKF